MSVSRSFSDRVAEIIHGDPDAVYFVLNAWQPYEGGANDYNNPLNSTLQVNGNHPLGGDYHQNNDNPVQEYPNETVGATATANTLLGGYYPDLLDYVRTGQANNPSEIAAQLRTWGTTGFAALFGDGGAPSGSTPAPSGGGGTTPAAPKGQDINAGFPFGIPGNPLPFGPGDIIDATGNVIGKLPGGHYIIDGAGNLIDDAGNILGKLPGGSYVVDAAGNIRDAGGKVVDTIANRLHIDTFRQIGDGLKWLLTPSNWFRLFFLAAGIGMMVMGGYIYVRGDKAITDAESVAGGIAKSAEAGAAA